MTSTRRRIASAIVVAAVVVGALLLQRQRRQEAVTLGVDLGPEASAITRLELDLVDEDHHLARRIDLRWPAGRAPTHLDRSTSLRPGQYEVTARVYKAEVVRTAKDRITVGAAGVYPVRISP